MIGAMDNGIILYVGDRFSGYFPYSLWGLAKRTKTSFGSLFDALRDIVGYGGIAKSYIDVFDDAAVSLSRNVSFDPNAGNQYFPIPDGVHTKLHPGRHGNPWSLLEATLCAKRMCELFENDYITGERIIPKECE